MWSQAGFTLLLIAGASAAPRQSQFLIDNPTNTCATQSMCKDPSNFGFQPNTVYTFKYDSAMSIGQIVPDNHPPLPFVSISTLVHIWAKENCEFELALYNVTFQDTSVTGSDTALNDENALMYAHNVERLPLRFAFYDGVIGEICPHKNEDTHSLNIKRAILSTLQNGVETLPERENDAVVLEEFDLFGEQTSVYIVQQNKEEVKFTRRRSGADFVTDSALDQYGLSKLDSSQTCTQTFSKEFKIFTSVACESRLVLDPFGADSQAHQVSVTDGRWLVYMEKSDNLTDFTSFDRTRITTLQFEKVNLKDGANNTLQFALSKAEKMCEEFNYEDNQVEPGLPLATIELSRAMKELSCEDLKDLVSRIEQNQVCTNSKATSLVQNVLPYVGNSCAIKIIVEKAQDQEFPLLPFHFLQDVDESVLNELIQFITLDHAPSEKRNTYFAISTLFGRSKPSDEVSRRLANVLASKLPAQCNPQTKAQVLDTVVILKAIRNARLDDILLEQVEACTAESVESVTVRATALETIEALAQRDNGFCEASVMNARKLFNNADEDTEIRIRSFLILSNCIDNSVLKESRDILENDGNLQVCAFVWSWLQKYVNDYNGDFELQQYALETILKDFNLKRKIEKLVTLSSFWMSQRDGYAMEGNTIFASSFVPRSMSVKLSTLDRENPLDMVEISARLEGSEAFFEKLQFFGSKLFATSFSDLVSGDNKLAMDGMKSAFNQNRAQPEDSMVSVRVLGQDVGLYDVTDLRKLMQDVNLIQKITEIIRNGQKHTFLRNALLLDVKHVLPTYSGFPLEVRFTAAGSYNLVLQAQMQGDSPFNRNFLGVFEPSAATYYDASVTVNAGATKAGLQLSHSGFTATKFNVQAAQVNGKYNIKFKIPEQQEIANVHNDFSYIYGLEKSATRNYEFLEECMPYPFGMKLCYTGISRDDNGNVLPFPYNNAGYILSRINEDPGMNEAVVEFQLASGAESPMVWKVLIDAPGAERGNYKKLISFSYELGRMSAVLQNGDDILNAVATLEASRDGQSSTLVISKNEHVWLNANSQVIMQPGGIAVEYSVALPVLQLSLEGNLRNQAISPSKKLRTFDIRVNSNHPRNSFTALYEGSVNFGAGPYTVELQQKAPWGFFRIVRNADTHDHSLYTAVSNIYASAISDDLSNVDWKAISVVNERLVKHRGHVSYGVNVTSADGQLLHSAGFTFTNDVGDLRLETSYKGRYSQVTCDVQYLTRIERGIIVNFDMDNTYKLLAHNVLSEIDDYESGVYAHKWLTNVHLKNRRVEYEFSLPLTIERRFRAGEFHFIADAFYNKEQLWNAHFSQIGRGPSNPYTTVKVNSTLLHHNMVLEFSLVPSYYSIGAFNVAVKHLKGERSFFQGFDNNIKQKYYSQIYFDFTSNRPYYGSEIVLNENIGKGLYMRFIKQQVADYWHSAIDEDILLHVKYSHDLNALQTDNRFFHKSKMIQLEYKTNDLLDSGRNMLIRHDHSLISNNDVIFSSSLDVDVVRNLRIGSALEYALKIHQKPIITVKGKVENQSPHSPKQDFKYNFDVDAAIFPRSINIDGGFKQYNDYPHGMFDGRTTFKMVGSDSHEFVYHVNNNFQEPGYNGSLTYTLYKINQAPSKLGLMQFDYRQNQYSMNYQFHAPSSHEYSGRFLTDIQDKHNFHSSFHSNNVMGHPVEFSVLRRTTRDLFSGSMQGSVGESPYGFSMNTRNSPNSLYDGDVTLDIAGRRFAMLGNIRGDSFRNAEGSGNFVVPNYEPVYVTGRVLAEEPSQSAQLSIRQPKMEVLNLDMNNRVQPNGNCNGYVQVATPYVQRPCRLAYVRNTRSLSVSFDRDQPNVQMPFSNEELVAKLNFSVYLESNDISRDYVFALDAKDFKPHDMFLENLVIPTRTAITYRRYHERQELAPLEMCHKPREIEVGATYGTKYYAVSAKLDCELLKNQPFTADRITISSTTPWKQMYVKAYKGFRWRPSEHGFTATGFEINWDVETAANLGMQYVEELYLNNNFDESYDNFDRLLTGDFGSSHQLDVYGIDDNRAVVKFVKERPMNGTNTYGIRTSWSPFSPNNTMALTIRGWSESDEEEASKTLSCEFEFEPPYMRDNHTLLYVRKVLPSRADLELRLNGDAIGSLFIDGRPNYVQIRMWFEPISSNHYSIEKLIVNDKHEKLSLMRDDGKEFLRTDYILTDFEHLLTRVSWDPQWIEKAARFVNRPFSYAPSIREMPEDLKNTMQIFFFGYGHMQINMNLLRQDAEIAWGFDSELKEAEERLAKRFRRTYVIGGCSQFTNQQDKSRCMSQYSRNYYDEQVNENANFQYTMNRSLRRGHDRGDSYSESEHQSTPSIVPQYIDQINNQLTDYFGQIKNMLENQQQPRVEYVEQPHYVYQVPLARSRRDMYVSTSGCRSGSAYERSKCMSQYSRDYYDEVVNENANFNYNMGRTLNRGYDTGNSFSESWHSAANAIPASQYYYSQPQPVVYSPQYYQSSEPLYRQRRSISYSPCSYYTSDFSRKMCQSRWNRKYFDETVNENVNFNYGMNRNMRRGNEHSNAYSESSHSAYYAPVETVYVQQPSQSYYVQSPVRLVRGKRNADTVAMVKCARFTNSNDQSRCLSKYNRDYYDEQVDENANFNYNMGRTLRRGYDTGNSYHESSHESSNAVPIGIQQLNNKLGDYFITVKDYIHRQPQPVFTSTILKPYYLPVPTVTSTVVHKQPTYIRDTVVQQVPYTVKEYMKPLPPVTSTLVQRVSVTVPVQLPAVTSTLVHKVPFTVREQLPAVTSTLVQQVPFTVREKVHVPPVTNTVVQRVPYTVREQVHVPPVTNTVVQRVPVTNTVVQRVPVTNTIVQQVPVHVRQYVQQKPYKGKYYQPAPEIRTVPSKPSKSSLSVGQPRTTCYSCDTQSCFQKPSCASAYRSRRSLPVSMQQLDESYMTMFAQSLSHAMSEYANKMLVYDPQNGVIVSERKLFMPRKTVNSNYYYDVQKLEAKLDRMNHTRFRMEYLLKSLTRDPISLVVPRQKALIVKGPDSLDIKTFSGKVVSVPRRNEVVLLQDFVSDKFSMTLERGIVHLRCEDHLYKWDGNSETSLWYFVYLYCPGLQLNKDWDTMIVSPEANLAGKVGGLLGELNMENINALTTPSGNDAENVGEYIGSWSLSSDYISPVPQNFTQADQIENLARMKDHMRDVCFDFIDPTPYLNALTDSTLESFERMVELYRKECSSMAGNYW